MTFAGRLISLSSVRKLLELNLMDDSLGTTVRAAINLLSSNLWNSVSVRGTYTLLPLEPRDPSRTRSHSTVS